MSQWRGECQDCGGGWTTAPEASEPVSCVFCGSTEFIQWTLEAERDLFT